jgi:hypothetical protein
MKNNVKQQADTVVVGRAADGKTCVICGGPIMPLAVPGDAPLKYCSVKCAAAGGEALAYRKLVEATDDGLASYCEYCGKAYTQKNYAHRYCSKVCATRGRVAKNEHKRAERLNSDDDKVRVCKQCGAFFEIKQPAQEFCSDKCRVKWNDMHTLLSIDEGLTKEIAAEIAMNTIFESGHSAQLIADKFGVSSDAVQRIAMSKEYIEYSRHFARLLAAQVQGKTVKNLIDLANMDIDPNEKDIGKKLAVKADANKFLMTRLFESAYYDKVLDNGENKAAPITIVYQMAPDSLQDAEANLVYIDDDDETPAPTRLLPAAEEETPQIQRRRGRPRKEEVQA